MKSQEGGREVLGVRCEVQRSDTNSEGRGLNPEGVHKERRADTKGTRTQLGKRSPGGGHEVPRGQAQSPGGRMLCLKVGHEV